MINGEFTQKLSGSSIQKMPLYKKALEIYALSRKLIESNSTHSLRQLYLSSIEQERLMEDMAVISLKLPFTIAVAQTSPSYTTKVTSSEHVRQHTTLLKRYCKRLKKNRLANQEHLSTLYKELQDFKKMHKTWSLLLTRQN